MGKRPILRTRKFSCRAFRKEVKILARKAVKKGALDGYAYVLKRQQDKESKAKMAERRAIENKDSSSSDDSMSVHNIEKQVLCSLAMLKNNPLQDCEEDLSGQG
jgi:hypothetical protein